MRIDDPLPGFPVPRIADEAPNMIAAPERIMGWAEHAKPGEEFVYASRAGLFASKSASMAAARRLCERGMVQLTQRGILGSAARNYVMRRTAKAWTAEHSVEARAVPAAREFVQDEARAINALMPVLTRAAQFNRPCPTDAQLADRAGIPREDIKPLMEAMAEQGLIRVKAAPPPTLRLVTIVATGHRTGMVG